MRELEEKIKKIFGEVAVNKGLALHHEVARLPRFISEYLISKYCAAYPKQEIAFSKLAEVVAENFPEPKDKDRVMYKLKSLGTIQIVDEFKVSVDLRRDLYLLHIPCLQIYNALADEGIVRRFERILSGMWGFGTLEYRPDLLEILEDETLLPILLIDIEPFQVYNVDVKSFIENRQKFTLDEWIDLIITTIGLNPNAYSFRQKLLQLTRLIPLIETNVNLMELGPRATGKTYLYRNLSHYTRIYSGGTISPARLFFDARLRLVGDIATHDLVVFDEISRIRFANPDEMAGKLKDFMVDGFFERGTLKRAHSWCSLVFLGNIEKEGILTKEIRRALPDIMHDSAFLDRIHGLIPGWEMPKIMKSEAHLAHGIGLAADYFAETIHEMRKESFRDIIDDHVEFGDNFTIRDENAVRKLASGLVKLLFPNREFNSSELRQILNLAVEMRQYIVDELNEMSPAEFPRKRLEVKVKG